jgi:hypothetical protein
MLLPSLRARNLNPLCQIYLIYFICGVDSALTIYICKINKFKKTIYQLYYRLYLFFVFSIMFVSLAKCTYYFWKFTLKSLYFFYIDNLSFCRSYIVCPSTIIIKNKKSKKIKRLCESQVRHKEYSINHVTSNL